MQLPFLVLLAAAVSDAQFGFASPATSLTTPRRPLGSLPYERYPQYQQPLPYQQYQQPLPYQHYPLYPQYPQYQLPRARPLPASPKSTLTASRTNLKAREAALKASAAEILSTLYDLVHTGLRLDVRTTGTLADIEAQLEEIVQHTTELQDTVVGVLRCDYAYTPTRGDPGSPLSYGSDAEIVTVEGWTFEAVQRGLDPESAAYPASEFRLVKADGTTDAYWNKNWDAVPNRSGYVKVREKVSTGPENARGYFEPEDYTNGTVYRYEASTVEAKMVTMVDHMDALGVSGIISDVGYSQQFQRKVAALTNAPVLLSGMQLLKVLSPVYGLEDQPHNVILVLTADSDTFNIDTMVPAGVNHSSVHILGLQNNTFGQWVIDGEDFGRLDEDGTSASVEAALDAVEEDVAGVIAELESQGRNVIALVAECGELPSLGNGLKRRLDLPFYDVHSGLQLILDARGHAYPSAYIMR